MSYLLPILIAVLLIAYSAGKPYLKERHRDKTRALPFKKDWRKIIQTRVPYFRKMPADLQLQLKQHIQVFLSEKKFVGCNGVIITDEIRVTIAAQACLLLLNKKTDYYPKLTTILVYPRAFIKEQQTTVLGGVKFTQRHTLAGESWEYGKVVLSWDDTVEGANVTNDGRNVVIHEFAHQLDQENGNANGAPILQKDQNYRNWSSVFIKHFELLKSQVNSGIISIFDSYGATNPAEFFAVSSEVFFEQSVVFERSYPELYQQLKQFYKVDPALW